MPLAAGSASTLVEIQTSTEARDPVSNEPVQTWALFRKAWVSIDVRRGGEYFETGSRYSQTIQVLKGDWLELRDVTPGMRIVMGVPQRILDIKTVLPDNDMRTQVRLECVAGEGAR